MIKAFAPTIVVFDNAGRSAQLRAAHRSGARSCSSAPGRASAARRFAGVGCACSMNTGLPIRNSSRATWDWLERFKLKTLGQARCSLSRCHFVAQHSRRRFDRGARWVAGRRLRALCAGRRQRPPRRRRCVRAILGALPIRWPELKLWFSWVRRKRQMPARLSARGRAARFCRIAPALLQLAAASGPCGTDEPRAACRQQRRLHAAAGHRLRPRLRRRSDCEGPDAAHSSLRGSRRGGRGGFGRCRHSARGGRAFDATKPRVPRWRSAPPTSSLPTV